MRKMDNAGELMCKEQADFFADSLMKSSESSAQFIRHFLTSDVAREFDESGRYDLLESFYREKPSAKRGGERYSKEELHWLGYLYRYIAYTRMFTSAQLFRVMPSKELRPYFPSYHTQDMERSARQLLEKFPVFPELPLEIIRRIFPGRKR
jgi:hypothetical protein